MNLRKPSFLPKIISPKNQPFNHTSFPLSSNSINYFELNFSNNFHIKPPFQTNTFSNNFSNKHGKFNFTKRSDFMLNNINHYSPNKNIRSKTNYHYYTKDKRQNIIPAKKEFTPKQPPNYSSKVNSKTNLDKQNANLSNSKECPLCHQVFEGYRYNFHRQNHPSRILPWLYLGSYRNASDKTDLKRLGINYVLNCAIECFSHYNKEIRYKHLKLNDLPTFNILPFLDRAVEFLQEAKDSGGSVLVHCQMGISRSTSCVMAYLIKKMNYDTLGALEFIRKKRKIVCPNYGFLEQLLTYENQVKGEY